MGMRLPLTFYCMRSRTSNTDPAPDFAGDGTAATVASKLHPAWAPEVFGGNSV